MLDELTSFPDQYLQPTLAEIIRRIMNPRLTGTEREKTFGTAYETTLAWDIGGAACVDAMIARWRSGDWAPDYDFIHNNVRYDAKCTMPEHDTPQLLVTHPSSGVVYVQGQALDSYAEFGVKSGFRFRHIRWAQMPKHQPSPANITQGRGYIFDGLNHEHIRTLRF